MPIVPEPFWSLVEKTETCWLWRGSFHEGYGNYVGEKAHKVAWRLVKGYEVPKGFVLHHRCNTRRCVNPDHLELMSNGAHTSLHKKGIRRRYHGITKSN